MSLYITRSKSKLPRVVHLSLVILATLALFIAAFPSFAATPQPQPQPESTNPLQALQAPDATCPPDGQCFADVPASNPFYAFINRIYQQDLVTGYPCGGPTEPCDPASRPYYRPINNVTRQQMAKFIDNARRLPEIYMNVEGGPAPIYSRNAAGIAISAFSMSSYAMLGQSTSGFGVAGTSQSGTGVYGGSISSYGVRGQSTNDYGVWGSSASSNGVYGSTAATNGKGVYGEANNGTDPAGVYGISTGRTGVFGISTAANGRGVHGTSDGTSGIGVYGVSLNGYAVYGYSATGTGVTGETGSVSGDWAGQFRGNVNVTGTCCGAGTGTFRIDHPLDPANQVLVHSAVESPDMKTVYDGNITTDSNGNATVVLPSYFEALNRDFRYQLTVIGEFAQAIVSSKIKDNRFTIKTDKPNVEVSWQVTGIRQDPYANAHRSPVEEDKPADEKGKYLHPTELGQPKSAGIDYERQQQMQEMGQQATVSKP